MCLSTLPDYCKPSSGLFQAERIWNGLIVAPLNPVGDYADYQNTLLIELFPLLDWEYCMERQRFSTLHQIVCGLNGGSLDFELHGSATVNTLDSNGRSALWYASTHRKLDYVRRLLERGADPNIGDPPIWTLRGSSPSYMITKLLLDYGAIISPMVSPDDGWLPWPCEFIHSSTESLAIDELLFRHGINLNHRAKWHGVEGVTELMRMAWQDSSPRLKQLIEFGADIEVSDEEGKTAVMYAVHAMSPKAFDSRWRTPGSQDRHRQHHSTPCCRS